MILHEWILINIIIFLLSLALFKTKSFPSALLLGVIVALMLFKFAYSDVTYNFNPIITNTTEYTDASNTTIKKFNYAYLETISLSKDDLIYPYIALLALILIDLAIRIDKMMRGGRYG